MESNRCRNGGAGGGKRIVGKTWIFEAGHLDMGIAGDPNDGEKRFSIKFGYDLKPRMEPKQMILTLKNEVNEWVVNQAIYELDGDKLIVSMTFNSKAGIVQPFPKTFEVKKGDELSSLFALERVRK